jgi:hypothetical protein
MATLASPGLGFDCPTPGEIISNVANSSPSLSQLNTFSTTVYDTAWLSMICKRNGQQSREELFHLFPQCFKLLLEDQKQDGSWVSYGSRFDAILNSLAALLALAKHCQNYGGEFESIQLLPRVEKAKSGIQKLLAEWNIATTVQVGFEVLVTGLLHQLESFDIVFDFSARHELQSMYERKMQRFLPELIYSTKQTTILHSLEAFVGVIDFDRVGHHCSEETGIMASPAATAAYLMHVTSWDQKAESYLTRVMTARGDGERGSIPSAFPTPIFELTWVCSLTGNDIERILTRMRCCLLCCPTAAK